MKNQFNPSVPYIRKKYTHAAIAFFAFLLWMPQLLAQTTISNFIPQSGAIGSSVTITGTGFNTTAADNIVYFGGVRATVTAASSTSLTVTVPAGDSHQPISVTSNYLTAYTAKPFIITVPGLDPLGADAFTTDYNRGANGITWSDSKSAITAGDLDGDGKPELVAANAYAKSISVYRNTGSAGSVSFVTSMDYATGAFSPPQAVAIGDLNGDGLPEIAVANGSGNSVTLFLNNSTVGNISLSVYNTYAAGIGAGSVIIRDVDGDGKPDLITNGLNASAICVLRNTSAGASMSFAAKKNITIGSATSHLSINDIDGDGKPDLAISSGNTSLVYLLQNTSIPGTVSFAAPVSLTTGTSPAELCLEDLDNDGRPDLAVANNGDNTLSVFRNTSSGGSMAFTPKTDYATGSQPSGISISDMDSDTRPNIAVGSSNSTAVTVFANTSSTGTISLVANTYTATDYSSSILATDLDVDGKPDLASANMSSNQVFIMRNIISEPLITSFTPNNGIAGTTVTITGSNLNDITAVRFGGIAAASFTVNSRTEITATVATGASGGITVAKPAGKAIAYYFTFFLPPTITSFTPVSAITGATVTITGTNFFGATGVSFGGVAASSFTYVSPTRITAKVGAGSSGDVSVTTPGGTAVKSGFTYIAPPVITSFTPTSATTGQTVTITGTGFTNTNGVSLGGASVAGYYAQSSTTILATVGNGASGDVKVAAAGGVGTLGGFIFIPPAPTINSFTPASAARGETITITGTNFGNASAVSFGGTAAASYTVVSPTSITAIVDAGASGDVTVTTTGGSGVLGGFTFIPAPIISSITPAAAVAGQTVTITGSHFSNATNLSFGGTAAASFTIVSPTTITAVVGSGASGDVSVTTPGGTGTLSSSFTFIAAPVINSIEPASAATGQSVIIKGNHFSNVTTVSLGGTTAASFAIVSPTIIIAVVGEGASGDVLVTTPGGTATLGGFTFIPAPVITSVSPATARSGDVVTITGDHFSGATAVSFGGTAVASFTVVSPMGITAVIGQGASGEVSLTTPGGTAVFNGFIYVQTSTGLSVYPNPARNKVWVSHPLSSNTTRITVVDMKGKELKHIDIGAGTSITGIPITELASGCYQIVWRDNTRMLTAALLVQ